MKNIIFLSLIFFLPIFLSAQDEEQDEKTTCETLIQEHMNQCEKCRFGEKCYTRKDLLEFCGGKQEQQVRVIDPGPIGCGCPTYGYDYSDYPYGEYHYGPRYKVGFGFSLGIGASYNLRGSYHQRGSYKDYGNYHNQGSHYDKGGYYYNGKYYKSLDFNPKNHSSYNSEGYYKEKSTNKVDYNNDSTSKNLEHYGSRPQSRRGG